MSERKNIVDANWHKYVDLGLPSGNLWAVCNVGAVTPEEYGDYFQWGRTSPFSPNMSMESGDSEYINAYAYRITVDGTTILTPEYDMATVNMGGSWVTPTIQDCEELISSLINKDNGVLNGFPIFSSCYNGKYITFPLAGYLDGRAGGTEEELKYSYFWANTGSNINRISALVVGINGHIRINDYGGYYGHSVRGVMHANPNAHVIRHLN